MPIIAYNPKDFNQKDSKTEKSAAPIGGKDNSQKETKTDNVEQTMMIGTPIFFSNIPNYCFNKLYKRKPKPFTEREGDWICNNCKNLNFSFRVECNRCKLPKDAKTNNKNHTNEHKDKGKDNSNDKENKKEQKPLRHHQRYHNHKKNHNKRKGNDGKE